MKKIHILTTMTVCNFETKSIKLRFKAVNVVTERVSGVLHELCRKRQNVSEAPPENKPIILYILKAP